MAVAPEPLLAKRTALRAFKTELSGFGSRAVFLESLSILDNKAKDAFCSPCMLPSEGSN